MNRFFSRAVLCVALCVGTILGSAGVSAAQSIWLDRSPTTTLLLEVLKPDFDGNEHLSTLTFFASGRFPITNRLAVVGQVPLANFSNDLGSSFSAAHGRAAPKRIEAGACAPASISFIPAVTYSPTPFQVQYHRRWRA